MTIIIIAIIKITITVLIMLIITVSSAIACWFWVVSDWLWVVADGFGWFIVLVVTTANQLLAFCLTVLFFTALIEQFL